MNLQTAQKFLKENDVKFILAQFVDIHGVAKTKSVPIAHFKTVLKEGAGFAGFAAWGLGMEPHDPDFMAVGDLSSLSLVPWQKGYARVVCDGNVEGKPSPLDTRVILKNQIAAGKSMGLTFNVGIEPEFMLLKRSESGEISVADPSDQLEKPCYDYKGLSRSRVFLEQLIASLQEVDFDVYQIDHEDANGQFEINYTYSDALNAADKYVFFRMAAGEIAQEFDLIASFMPKLFRNKTGNGMHMHVSAQKGNKKNAFEDKSDRQGLGLSKLGYHFLAGVLKHARALTAFSAPSVNSYKRLVVGESMSGATWAPAYVTYGDNNRSAMVRVPFGRLEYRLADSSCNPYLAMAAMLAAGMDGITKALNPGPAMNVNLYEMSESQKKKNKIEVLPQNLGEALDELEKDRFFRNALGGSIVDEFLKIKRMEWVDYCRHVSDWEKDRYIEFY